MKENSLSAILTYIRKFRPVHLHWSNLDLAIGAMMCQLAVNRLPGGKTVINLQATFVLGLAVFVISSMNRLLDNRKPARTAMKRFLPNQKNRITFLELVAGGLVLAVFLGFYLPGNLWKFVLGIVLSSGFIVWLTSKLPERSILHVFRVPVSALLFTAGIVLVMLLSDETSKEIKYSVLLFFLISLQNFLLCSDDEVMQYPNVSSLAGWLKALRTRQLLHLITFLVLTGGAWICHHTEFRYTQRLSVILILMAALQSLMTENRTWMKGNPYKGMLIRLVLVIPLLIL